MIAGSVAVLIRPSLEYVLRYEVDVVINQYDKCRMLLSWNCLLIPVKIDIPVYSQYLFFGK